MRHVAEKTLTPIEQLYETIGWPLNKKYGHSLDAFKLSITYAFLGYSVKSSPADPSARTAILMFGMISSFQATPPLKN